MVHHNCDLRMEVAPAWHDWVSVKQCIMFSQFGSGCRRRGMQTARKLTLSMDEDHLTHAYNPVVSALTDRDNPAYVEMDCAAKSRRQPINSGGVAI